MFSFPETGGLAEGVKGYAYTYNSIAPGVLVPSLDIRGPVFQTRFRLLEQSWYLFDGNGGVIMP
jgi:hypothetical protein